MQSLMLSMDRVFRDCESSIINTIVNNKNISPKSLMVG